MFKLLILTGVVLACLLLAGAFIEEHGSEWATEEETPVTAHKAALDAI
jgi:hypothetical protein